jgi:hypothetical protein
MLCCAVLWTTPIWHNRHVAESHCSNTAAQTTIHPPTIRLAHPLIECAPPRTMPKAGWLQSHSYSVLCCAVLRTKAVFQDRQLLTATTQMQQQCTNPPSCSYMLITLCSTAQHSTTQHKHNSTSNNRAAQCQVMWTQPHPRAVLPQTLNHKCHTQL